MRFVRLCDNFSWRNDNWIQPSPEYVYSCEQNVTLSCGYHSIAQSQCRSVAQSRTPECHRCYRLSHNRTIALSHKPFYQTCRVNVQDYYWKAVFLLSYWHFTLSATAWFWVVWSLWCDIWNHDTTILVRFCDSAICYRYVWHSAIVRRCYKLNLFCTATPCSFVCCSFGLIRKQHGLTNEIKITIIHEFDNKDHNVIKWNLMCWVISRDFTAHFLVFD